MLSARWTPEMRTAQGARNKAQFDDWASEHPDRAAFVARLWADVEAGAIERPACDDCARPMHPAYDWEAMAVTGWRCRSHPTRVRALQPPPPAGSAADEDPLPSWLR
jgi:hypothetical protein